MPELPDVEIFKQYFDATSLHKTIGQVEVENAKVLQGVSAAKLSRSLKDRKFESTRRHGKYLFAKLDRGPWLVLHFGMTGFLRYFKEKDDELEHIRVLWSFDNGYHLAFVCQRMFGEVSLAEDMTEFVKSKKLGPDAAALDLAGFKKIIQGKRGAIKSFLMNQKYLAGIGNVYADEILFQSRIHPQKPVNELNGEQIRNLHQKMQQVFKVAVESRADPAQFPDNFLVPRRHPGGECPKCKGTVARRQVSGRTAYFCPQCQG